MPRPLRSVAALGALALAAALLPLASQTATAADDDPAFRPLASVRLTGPDVLVRPAQYTAFRVDSAEIRARLAAAPREGSAGATTFSVPTPEGTPERFAVQRTQVMQPRLAAAHPDIATWSGRSLDHPGTTIALDVTPMGFHAAVRGPDGQDTWYVDPAYNQRGATTHLSYYVDSLPQPRGSFVEREGGRLVPALAGRAARVAAGALVKRRVYRLALLSDPTYAHYFGSDNVLAAKVTLINRVDQLYLDDLAIKMVLVNGTDKLNLDTQAKATGTNGPCGAHACYDPDPDPTDDVPGQLDACMPSTVVRNAAVLGQLIGASHYDIGHLALGTDGGGISGIGVVGTGEKAEGCTGLPTPVGDFYAVDYVAHEMGHEFGATHTFNGFHGACGHGNRYGPASVEPASGSSIMAYAGICGHDDLQSHSDPYFSQASIGQIHRYTSTRTRPTVEVQDVSLEGFGAGASITLGYPGASGSVTLIRGSSDPATAYNAANLRDAVEELTGESKVTVAGWGYDPYADPRRYPAPLTRPDATGFEVIFAGDGAYDTRDSDFKNMDPLIVTSDSPGVSAHDGETARGGAADNRGFRVVTTHNHAPVVHAPADKTLPIRTPFTLTGSATDRDGNKLSYLWEQNDVGGGQGTALTSNDKRTGPLFRIFGTASSVTARGTLQSPSPGENHAGRSGSRTFPDMQQILAGDTDARTGRCPRATVGPSTPVPARLVDCYSEYLPTAAYVGRPGSAHPAMHFRLTARDDDPRGGGVGHDDVTLRLDRHAGPFLVTSLGRHTTVGGGSTRVVRWQVNGTRRLASAVRILLSTDNGHTWRHLLVRRTANDGRATVRFPAVHARKAWLRIDALGNYFFDVNDASFRIS